MPERKTILVMAGTKEGKEIARILSDQGHIIYESRISHYDSGGPKEEQGVIRITQPLSYEKIIELAKEKDIGLVVDATHPYAVNASKNAISACQNLGIRYIRYEREATDLPQSPFVFPVKNYDEAASRAFSLGKRIFLTIGSRQLKSFVELARRSQASLIVRVLPWEDSIKICRSYGLSPDQILAMQGPFSKELNLALFKEYKAEVIVSKNTGPEGGFKAKLDAALELKIPIVVIERPKIDYPSLAHHYSHILNQINS
jgi:precorrin-6A/cobalt-precorrin-6A reductase